MHHLNRYHKFIRRCQQRPLPPGKFEDHHIIPRCLGGLDLPHNMIRLTPREHFLAHWMLASAHPDVVGLSYAFVCMYSTGNPTKLDLKSSRIYERGRAALQERIGAANRKLVTVLDTRTGETRRVRREEYESSEHLVGVMAGRTVAVRVSTGERVVCTKEQLNSDPDLVHVNAGRSKGEQNYYFRGYYITPLGRFSSAEDVATAHNLKSLSPVVTRCKVDTDKVLGPRSFNSSTDLTKEQKSLLVGKTWREVGWYFEPTSSPE